MKRSMATGRMAAVVLLVGAISAGCATTPEPLVDGGMVLSDPEVAGIFTTANEGEIATSRVALQKAQSAAVRAFAQRMVTDHTRANEQTRATGVTPVMNAPAQALQRSATETADVLRSYEGAAFDLAYIRSQIDTHRYTLSTLDNALIPAARSNDLEGVLRMSRPIVAEHLEMAQRILNQLGG